MTSALKTGPRPTAINLCGTFKVELEGKRVEHELPGRGGRLAFAYLVISRDRPISRDALAAAIWEDNAPQNPDSALRTLLTRLRAVVGKATVSGRGEISLALPNDTQVDLEVASFHLAEAERARGERHWQGAFESGSKALPVLNADLLPALHADWVELARRSHSELRMRALACVATAGLELGADLHAIAEGMARRMIELEPLRETGHALLIRALAVQGDRAKALLTYEELRQLLREELGISPGPELRQLHQQLLEDRDPHVASAPPTGVIVPHPQLELPTRAVAQGARPLFGRSSELSWLERELEPGHAEGRTVALLRGEPGIGKTRLAAEFGRRAHARGANVLWGSCHDGGFVPYEPFAEVVRQRLTPLDDDGRQRLLERTGTDVLELVPGLTRGQDVVLRPNDECLDATTQRYRLFDAVSSLLIEAAQHRPLVVVLEDLHWAHPSTLNLLLHLHRVEERAPIVVLGTYRAGEVIAGKQLARTLAELRRVARVVTSELTGLSEQHTHQLVSALFGRAAEPQVTQRIHARSEGNPFFISEIVRGGQAVGRSTASDVSDGVKDLLTRRIGNLSGDAVELLNTASVIGREFDRVVLEKVCSHDSERILDLIEESIEGRVIEEVPGEVLRYSFGHALIREALYGDLSRTRRERVHRAIAESLSPADAEVGLAGAAELAHHLHAAIDGSEGASRAMRASIRAGDYAMSQRAYEDAAGHYDRAFAVVEQAGIGNAKACGILLARGAAQRRSGDAPTARTTFERAADLARALSDGRQLASAALGFGGRDHVPLASGPANERLVELLEEALLYLPGDATGLRARLLGRLSIELPRSSACDRRSSLSGEALVLARESGDEAVIGYALTARRLATWSPGNVQERLALSSETVAIAERIDDPELTLQGRQWLAADLLEKGDVTRAADEMRLHARLAQSLHQPFHLWVAGGLRVTRAHLEGEFKRAESLAERAYANGVRAHEDDAFQSLSAQLFWIRRDQGRSDELGDLIEQALERFASTGAFWQAGATLHASETGTAQHAAKVLDRLAEGDGLNTMVRDPNWCATVVCLAESAGRIEHRASAAQLYQALAPYGSSNVVVAHGTICLGAASRYLGILARTQSWWRLAEEHFEHALSFDTALGAPALVARTQHEYALMLSRRGRAQDEPRILAMAESARATGARLGMTELERAALPMTRLGRELGSRRG